MRIQLKYGLVKYCYTSRALETMCLKTMIAVKEAIGVEQESEQTQPTKPTTKDMIL